MLLRGTNADEERILQYIGKDYACCLYLYMDLIKYGSDSEFTKTWIQSNDNGVITCVMLSYHTALHIFARGTFDITEVVDLVREIKPSQICAFKPVIEALQSPLALLGYETEIGYVGKLEYHGHDEQDNISRATIDDVDEIAQLIYDDAGIGNAYSLEDLKTQMRERLSQGFVRSYVIKVDNHVAAHLGTGAEVGNVSIVSYVITDERYRGHGFALKLYQAACRELQQEGKEVYAVYYVENSIRLHHKVGFIDCCEYGKLFLKTH